MGILTDQLKENRESDVYPFHMPGHKRKITGEDPYGYDITEICGFDDLHNTCGVLESLRERIAGEYLADMAWVLVNGSSSGVMAAVSSCVRPGEKILMARNCHKSAYNAVMLRGIRTEYIYPQTDPKTGISLGINPKDVDLILKNNREIKAVLITSPTYEGVISDVKAIADTVHRYGVILITDCAHGAHLGLDTQKTVNPIACGSDIVVMSLHKTLPAMTQTAVLCARGNLVDYEALDRYFDIYTSTSPSYVLMSSVEKCFDIIDNGGLQMWEKYYKMVGDFRQQCKKLKNLYLWKNDEYNYDEGKIVIATDRAGTDGHMLMNTLRERYHLEPEMESAEYVLAMTSCCDDEKGFERLQKALSEIDEEILPEEKNLSWAVPETSKKYEAFETEYMKKKYVSIEEAKGMVSASYIYAYPPGIPWIVPGEIITEEIVEYIIKSRQSGLTIRGVKGNSVGVIGEK